MTERTDFFEEPVLTWSSEMHKELLNQLSSENRRPVAASEEKKPIILGPNVASALTSLKAQAKAGEGKSPGFVSGEKERQHIDHEQIALEKEVRPVDASAELSNLNPTRRWRLFQSLPRSHLEEILGEMNEDDRKIDCM
jgi:hypothetical protein